MSEDRHEPDSTNQATDPRSSSAESADSNTQPGFKAATIRSYLSEQFGVREVATPVQHAAPVAPSTDANAELAKWRERVPKLAFALKERTAQVGLLEAELARLQTEASNVSGPAAGAGLKARDEHIAALELKLAGLTTSYQNSEGSLRARELELEGLRADSQASKQRWQSLTDALDQQVASTEQVQAQLQLATDREAQAQEQLRLVTDREVQVQAQLQLVTDREVQVQAQLQLATDREAAQQTQLDAQQFELAANHGALDDAQQALAVQVATNTQLAEQLKDQTEALEEVQEQLVGLDERNEKLLETTELANRQLVSLSEDISRLQAELISKEQEFVAKLAEQKQLNQLDTAQIQAEHSERLRDIHAQTLLVFEAVERQNLEEQRSGIAAMQASLEADFSVQEQKLQREYVELQQAASGLMQQVNRLQNQVVQQQQITVQANAEHADARQREANKHQQDLLNVTLALEAEVHTLEQQIQAQPFVDPLDEVQPRIVLLGEISDANDRQIVLLGDISDANEGRSDFAQAWRNLDDHSIDAANETIRELERLLQIRNGELNAALAARLHFLPATSQTSPLSPLVTPDSDALKDADADTPDAIATLQAQVGTARAENERLRQQLERTSAALLASDDLTQLKGVGGKLAEQLRELGISQFAQMAELDLRDLEAPDHPLFNLRGRIARNGWIEQAKALIHPLTLYGER